MIVDGFGRVMELLEPAVDGLSQGELNKQPAPDCNSIGWIAWHLTRGQDVQIADLMGGEQTWIKDKWYLKFGRPANPGDTGFGDTADDVAAFKSPKPDVFLEYYKATLEQTKNYISKLTARDLDKVIDESYDPPVTIGVRLISIMADCLQHSGEIAYLRGLLKGKGWLGY